MTGNSIENYTPTKICFLENGMPDLDTYLKLHQKSFLIVSKSVSSFHGKILAGLPKSVILHVHAGSNPDLRKIEEMDIPPDCTQIIGMGGGSVLDTARACFAKILTGRELSLKELIATPSIFNNYRDRRSGLSLILIPTTFGTSSELTKWGTVWDWNENRKYSISHELLYADMAIICPELSRTVSWTVTASTGLDVFSHALESLWSKDCNFITRTLALASLSICLDTLPYLLKDLDSSEKRAAQARAAVLAGLAFSQTRTAAAHALSYPLTLFHRVPHGFACSLTLGAMFEYNYSVRKEGLQELLTIFKNKYGDRPGPFIEYFNLFLDSCKISRELRHYGVSLSDIPRLVDNAFHPDRFNNMLYSLSRAEVAKIYEMVM